MSRSRQIEDTRAANIPNIWSYLAEHALEIGKIVNLQTRQPSDLLASITNGERM